MCPPPTRTHSAERRSRSRSKWRARSPSPCDRPSSANGSNCTRTSSRICVAARTADLERSESRLAAILNALPDLVFVVNREGRYLEILTSKEELLYRPATEMKGRRFHDILPQPVADAHLRQVRQTIETRASQTIEYSLRVRAGERWFEGRTGLLGRGHQRRPCRDVYCEGHHRSKASRGARVPERLPPGRVESRAKLR